MNYGLRLALVASTLLSVALSAHAQVEQKIRLDGKEAKISVPVGTKTITLWGESKGNSAVPFGMLIDAPKGTAVEVAGAPLRTGGPAKVRPRSWFPIELAKEVGGSNPRPRVTVQDPRSSVRSLPQTAALTRASSNIDAQCRMLTEDVLQQLIDYLTQEYGGTWNRESVCAFVFGDEETPVDPGPGGGGGDSSSPVDTTTDPNDTFYSDPRNGAAAGYGHLLKDSCDARAKRYLVKMTIDLSAVDHTQYQNDIEIRIRAAAKGYSGKKAATIKPVSDGMFAPHPLLLMSSVGGWGGKEKINLTRWSKGKPGKLTSIEIKDHVSYHSLYLTRSVIGAQLRGGRGVFTISNGSEAYSVCFSLVRSRQRINGYPS